MKKGGVGGAHTAKKGSDFENSSDSELISALQSSGYELILQKTLSKGAGSTQTLTLSNGANEIDIFYKAGIYKHFFDKLDIDARKIFSARLEPDSAIYSHKNRTLTIIEKKQQTGAGSVAEKLQTCDYKRFYYEKLLEGTEIKLEIVWLLGQYFLDQRKNLQSVFEYMESKGSKYYFLSIPVEELAI